MTYTLKLRNDENLGSPYNRGRADSYYQRKSNPHYYEESPYLSDKVTKLSKNEKEEYLLGFQENEKSGDRVDPTWLMN
jgi:hypothetical protein